MDLDLILLDGRAERAVTQAREAAAAWLMEVLSSDLHPTGMEQAATVELLAHQIEELRSKIAAAADDPGEQGRLAQPLRDRLGQLAPALDELTASTSVPTVEPEPPSSPWS